MMNPKGALLIVLLLIVSGCDSDDINGTNDLTKPTVDAGADQLHTLPKTTLTLKGSAKSYPKNFYSIKETKWTQISGPQQLTILNDKDLTATLVNPTMAGTYVFELYAKDSGSRTNTDKMKVILQNTSVMSMVRKTTGYADDYDAVWNSVVEDYANYVDIEQKWQSMYQPYFVEAENIQLEQEWQSLLKDMADEVGDIHIVALAQHTTQSVSTDSEQDTDSAPAPSPVIQWESSNNIGVITFNDLSSLSLTQLNRSIQEAVYALQDTHELWLKFPEDIAISEQKTLQLLSWFTFQPTSLRLETRQGEEETIPLMRNPLLTQSTVLVKGHHDSHSATTLTEYLLGQASGEESFSFKREFVLLSTPLGD
ncbi:PKD domain-containing protein [Vibrio genomosp. F10]|uniref:Uncharacterized protein n=1 Tax=Vibrio genomosp. F10 TaxID=723171 RepID=A0A1B9R0M1_9VIBR|nr:hypothetical protein [Vibrio genomosp. F10]OCH77365.1 hypothetical protein A6E14_07700 [Vibrio genomosp. F10]